MIFLSILFLIVAIALPSINQNISTILYVRITSIIFIYAGALALNALYIQSIGSGIGIYSSLFQINLITSSFNEVDGQILVLSSFFIKKNNKSLVSRAINEFKIGWSLSKLPDHIIILEKNIYIRLIPMLGPVCVFLVVRGIAQQLHKLIFYYIFMFSFLYSLYRLFIVLYFIKQFIVNVYTGKLIVRNSPVNSFNSILRTMGNVAKTTVNFTVGTGITYALCYELDEILVQEGKEPYFVPGIRGVVQNIGAEEYAKRFLNSLGIKDRIDTNSSKSITELLESMDENRKKEYEAETGQSWEKIYNEQKELQETLRNFIVKKDKSVTENLKDFIEKKDPFKKNKK